MSKLKTLPMFFGGSVEWYDFILYMVYSPILAQHFLPSAKLSHSLVYLFTIFSIGYLSRPIGAILFGIVGDKFGRKKALLMSIFIITFSTFCIGLVPSMARIGIAAPIILLILRLLQGIAVSGDLVGLGIWAVENAPPQQLGRYLGLVMGSLKTGVLLGIGCSSLITFFYTEQQIINYAWRIPFLSSLLVGLLSIYYRMQLVEFHQLAAAESTLQQVKSVANNVKAIAVVFLLTAPMACSAFLIVSYFPVMLRSVYGMTQQQSNIYLAINLITLIAGIAVSAKIIDKGNYKHLYRPGLFLLGFCQLVGFFVLQLHSFAGTMISFLFLAIGLTPIITSIFSISAEFFPKQNRYLGVALGYNLAMSLLGGTIPLLATWMTNTSGVNPMIFLYLAAWTSASYLFLFRDRLSINLCRYSLRTDRL